MYLGQLIEELGKHDPSTILPLGFTDPHSYRGYYERLAFEPAENVTIGSMLECARSSLGRTFTGYKGGEFEMHEYSEVYLAEYGNCGEEIGPLLLRFMLEQANRSAQDAERRIVEARIEGMREGLAESKRHFSHVAAESALEERISELRASLASDRAGDGEGR